MSWAGCFYDRLTLSWGMRFLLAFQFAFFYFSCCCSVTNWLQLGFTCSVVSLSLVCGFCGIPMHFYLGVCWHGFVLWVYVETLAIERSLVCGKLYKLFGASFLNWLMLGSDIDRQCFSPRVIVIKGFLVCEGVYTPFFILFLCLKR